jgi:hypothetical protein
MKERITKVVDKSRVVWENLEAWVREKIQGYVQDLLEEEVTALLGREKSEIKRLMPWGAIAMAMASRAS